MAWPGALEPSRERRIAAIVLPELACEIAAAAGNGAPPPRHAERKNGKRPARSARPLGVVLIDDEMSEQAAAEVKPTAPLASVNHAARHFGVREGQSIAEARALVAELIVRTVTLGQLRAALGRVAEIALAFGPCVALELPDTIWVDVTGVAHLMGGEPALAAELVSRVRAIGHVNRVALASGPRLARAFARWGARASSSSGERGYVVVEAAQTRAELERLPLTALPIDPESASWFARLGVLSVGELTSLPRSSVAARLGKDAPVVLALCAGHDPEPLVKYEPPEVLTEQTSWDEAIEGIEPLLFVLRGLTARVSARLAGRGQAAQKLRLFIDCDRAIARLREVSARVELEFELAAPLWREQELGRIVASRLERLRLEAPSTGLMLQADALTAASEQQLDFARVASGLTTACQGLEQLPVLLAELNADVGAERVGVLALADDPVPEQKCRLVPALSPRERAKKVVSGAPRGARARPSAVPAELTPSSTAPPERALVDCQWPNAPSRLLPNPVPLDAPLKVGATLAIEHHLYTIRSIRFEQRLEAVHWWAPAPVARDYLRLWLAHKQGGVEALVYVDRETGARYLQAFAD